MRVAIEDGDEYPSHSAPEDQINIHNEIHGNTKGGDEFQAIKPQDASHLSSLQIWTHMELPDYEILRGIKLTWSTGETQTYGTTDGWPRDEARFARNERITQMVIWSSDWVDAISYRSTLLPQGRRLGGPGGNGHAQDHGNGVFLGLHGRCGSSIDALGAVFEIRRHLVASAAVPSGPRGGSEFIAQPVDDRAFVTSLRVWTTETSHFNVILRGILVEWSSGNQYMYGNCNGMCHDEVAFAAHERITEFSIWGDAWVDAISYKSTAVPHEKKIGGPGGIRYAQDVGNGTFVGLWGRCGQRIDALGAVFSKSDQGVGQISC